MIHSFFTRRMPFLPPSQQHQSTEGNWCIRIREKTLEFSSVVLPAPSPYRGISVPCNTVVNIVPLENMKSPKQQCQKYYKEITHLPRLFFIHLESRGNVYYSVYAVLVTATP